MSKRRWTSEDIGDQTGRVAIVTGANSGIGFETAKALAAKGATVIVASRNEQRGTDAVEAIKADLPQANVELIQLDLASLTSVRAFVATFTSRHERLDLLINNAGVMMPTEREETADGFRAADRHQPTSATLRSRCSCSIGSSPAMDHASSTCRALRRTSASSTSMT